MQCSPLRGPGTAQYCVVGHVGHVRWYAGTEALQLRKGPLRSGGGSKAPPRCMMRTHLGPLPWAMDDEAFWVLFGVSPRAPRPSANSLTVPGTVCGAIPHAFGSWFWSLALFLLYSTHPQHSKQYVANELGKTLSDSCEEVSPTLSCLLMHMCRCSHFSQLYSGADTYLHLPT
jgi:hypothetical protein